MISLDQYILDGANARKNIDVKRISKFSKLLEETFKKGGKLITFGNGGSAADAQHFVGELDGHFTSERRALPAIALSTNTSSMTAIANDYSYEDVFARPVAALANKGDIVVGISTSGNSKNVIKAIYAAKEKGAYTLALTGRSGGKLKDIVDELFNVDSDFTPIIQEIHISIIHMICLELDRILEDSQQS
jgi:D-sedoheptulose 7-phosphate isomerase